MPETSTGKPVMKFYFCEKCGKRLTENDIDAGDARNKKLRGVYCNDCAEGVLTLDTVPMSQEEARELLASQPKQEQRRTTPQRGVRKTAGSGRGSRAMPESQRARPEAEPRRGQGMSPALIGVGAGGVVALVLVGLFFFSGSSPKPPGKKKTASTGKKETAAANSASNVEAPKHTTITPQPKPKPATEKPPSSKTVTPPPPPPSSGNAGDWEDIIADRSLQGWQITRGKWKFENDILVGIPGRGMARMETKAHYKDIDLEATVLVENTRYAEVQIRNFARVYPIGFNPGRWVKVKLTARGTNVTLTVDGQAMKSDGSHDRHLSGWIALYVKKGGRIKVKELKVRKVE